MKLVNNPEVIYAGEKVGGVEVVAMSHIPGAFTIPVRVSQKKVKQHTVDVLAEPATEPWRAQWQAITNALTAAGYEGDGPQLLTTAGQLIDGEWNHPQHITAEEAQKILATVRDNNEDSFYVGDRLILVADGMGGHASGEVASRLVRIHEGRHEHLLSVVANDVVILGQGGYMRIPHSEAGDARVDQQKCRC